MALMVETLQEAGNLAVLSHFAASVIDRNDGNYTAIVLTHIQGVLHGYCSNSHTGCAKTYPDKNRSLLQNFL